MAVPSSDSTLNDRQPELLQQIGSYNLLRTSTPEGFMMYDVQNTDGEQQVLHLESYVAREGEQSFYCAYWDSAAPVGEFLIHVDDFLTRHAVVDPEHAHQARVVFSGDRDLNDYEGERPITLANLIEAEGEEIGSEAERLRFLRIENNVGAFTWERGPIRSGFIVTPSKFPDQTELQRSLTEVYEASRPAIPTTIFREVLVVVATDAFQNPRIAK